MTTPRSPLLTRLLLSLAVGLAVFALSGAVAYHQYNTSMDIRIPQDHAQRVIRDLYQAVDEYCQDNRTLPKTLMDLPIIKNEEFFPTDKIGAPIDRWHHPYHYWTDGNKYRITSYGRDGKPGGKGYDYDITGTGPLPKAATPTVGQFLTDAKAARMIKICALGGIAAFILAFLSFRQFALGRREFRSLVIRLIVTIVAATIVAIMISALHIPTGH